MKKQYAIIQANYGVLGLGDSVEAALADAKQWGAEVSKETLEMYPQDAAAGQCFSTDDPATIAEYRDA